jgi:hypothetical protein
VASNLARVMGSDLVKSVCSELLLDVDDVADSAVARIRREFPEYAVVDAAEHTALAVAQMSKVIGGFRDCRRPARADVVQLTVSGRLRAEAGLPIEVILGGNNTGFDVLWDALRDRFVARDAERQADLVPLVSLMMSWSRGFEGAIAEGYAAASSRDDRLAFAQVFVESIAHGGGDEEAARALGFAPAGTFQVICAAAGNWPPAAPHDLRRALRERAAVVVLEGTLTVVVQDIPVKSVLALLGDGTVAGVGLPRPGLAGAADSLADAERALTLAHRLGTVVHFERDWLLATLLPQAHRLAPLTRTDAGREHPHLAEAVRAYAGNHFSIAAGAEALDLHANTVKYRLSRWHEITGWDPRTLDGLMRSLISLLEA